MGLDKPYADIPGTTIFDTDQARAGYWLNQFCMSLIHAENRERFLADERAYLDEWEMSEDQKQGVLDRDFNALIATGGNIYYLAKIGGTDGQSFATHASTATPKSPPLDCSAATPPRTTSYDVAVSWGFQSSCAASPDFAALSSSGGVGCTPTTRSMRSMKGPETFCW